MNTLSLSAVFGILVLIFQDGRLQGLLSTTARERSTPRSRSCWSRSPSASRPTTASSCSRGSRRRDDGGVPDSEAVAVGLERTGRIVTAAAVLFAVAIGAFATSKLVFIKELGIGVALAVLIDASIIRALLVPSLMELLGSLELVGTETAAPPARPDRAAARANHGATASTQPDRRHRRREQLHPHRQAPATTTVSTSRDHAPDIETRARAQPRLRRRRRPRRRRRLPQPAPVRDHVPRPARRPRALPRPRASATRSSCATSAGGSPRR